MTETKITRQELRDLIQSASGDGEFSDLTKRYESYRDARGSVVKRNEELRFLANREDLDEIMRFIAKSEIEQAKEALEKFRAENKRSRGFFLSVLKKEIDDVEENISFLQKVYDEVRYLPYDDDDVEIDEGESPGGFLLGYVSDFEDLKYEEPENRQKEFLRIAVSAVAVLPNDIQDVEEHLGRHTHEGRKASRPTPCGRRGRGRGLTPFFLEERR